MKFSVQVIMHPDDDGGGAAVVREVFALDRDALAPDTLGLRLAEAQDLLVAVQDTIVAHQVQSAVAAQTACPACGRPRRHKDTRAIVVRSLFGALRLPSPRWWHCDCRTQRSRTFQPLAELLPDRTTPELAYLQARFAGLVSYGITAKLLGELLPLGRRLHPAVVRRQTQAVAQRLEDELGDERFSFIDTCQRVREELPRPDLPLVVGLDGGYVHSAAQRSRRDGWFEVIAGKGRPRPGAAQLLRVRADLRHQAETAALRGAHIPRHGGQPAGHVPHRRWRGHPRTALPPQPAGRAPARLVPPHDADHGHDQHGQIPATAPAGSRPGAVGRDGHQVDRRDPR